MKKLVSMLLALMLICAATLAFAEPGATQELKLGNVTFQIPADLTVTDSNDFIITTSNANYELQIMVIDWAQLDPELRDLTDGSAQTDMMFFFLYLILSDADVAMQATNMCGEEDIGLLNGDPVKHGTIGGELALCAHTYRDTGIALNFMATDGYDANTMLEIGDEIMRSARYDGVTEDDMILDAQVDYVVITADSGKIRTEASISGGLIKTAYKGESFELVEEITDWFVVIVDGRTGYIHKGVAAIQ